jgi:hypothetical protein
MSMRIEQYDVIAGVEWSVFEASGKAKKAASACQYSVIHGNGEEWSVGHTNENHGKNAYSGAMILALYTSDAVLYEQLNNGMVWFAAVRAGMPLPGFDQICDENEARRLLSETMSFMPNAQLIGTIAETQHSFGDIINAVGNDKQKALLRKKRNPLVWIALVGITLIVIMFSGLVYKKIKDTQAAEASAEALKQAAMAEATRKQTLKQEYVLATRAAIQARQKELSVIPDSKQQYDNMMAVVASIPPSQSGWKPNIVECNDQQCAIKWTLLPKASGYNPPMGKVVAQDDESVTTEIDVQKAAVITREPTTRSQILAISHSYFGVGNLVTTVGKQLTPITIAQPAPPASLLAGKTANAQPPIEIARQGAVTINAAPILMASFIDKLKGRVSIKKMTLNLGLDGSQSSGIINITIDTEYVDIPKVL